MSILIGKGGVALNILYCGDTNVCAGIFLSALSMSKHTSRPLHIYIFTAYIEHHRAIPSQFADALENKIKEYNSKSSVSLFDISEVFETYLPYANMGTRFTPLCMLRLFADLVPQIPDKILYLDADVLIRADCSALYDLDILDAEIAGVPDRYGKWFFGNVLLHDYLNSGVLLLNMRKIRASGLFSECRTLCRDRKMFMPDQTALNKLARKKKLPRKYNEQGKIRSDTVCKHFTTFFRVFPYIHPVTVKPWEYEKLHSELGITEFDDIIEEFKRSTFYAKGNPDFFYN